MFSSFLRLVSSSILSLASSSEVLLLPISFVPESGMAALGFPSSCRDCITVHLVVCSTKEIINTCSPVPSSSCSFQCDLKSSPKLSLLCCFG